MFLDGGNCNDLARAAIRAVFHDFGSWDVSQGLHGGCDGSLVIAIIPDVELDRPENKGLSAIAGVINATAIKYGTSVVVFAGSE